MPGKQSRKMLADVEDAAEPTLLPAGVGGVRTIPDASW